MANWYWIISASALVFIMQAGFLCLESGRIRSKNSINVAAKNISDFVVSTAIFWLFGFGIMFGQSVSGWFGSSEFLFDESHTPFQISFFIFQMMFCGTAATLTSGAVAERMSFLGYLAITVLLSAIIYPVVGHWAWGGAFSGNGPQGWLESMGFIDFAGATVVHSVGGWVALAAIMIVGPRLGRFEQGIRLPPGNNLPLSALGVLLIWFGWIGFNGGSTLALTADVPLIILNTFIAAAWGGICAAALNYYKDKYIEVSSVLNGVIAGLVAITACCHLVTPGASVIIGAIAGWIGYYGAHLMERARLDDALEIVPAHLFAGIWGTLCVALFGQADKITTGLSFWQQLGVQGLGIAVIGVYCFTVAYVGISLLNRIIPLRVSKKHEEQGLNVSEHRATTEMLDLLNSMQYQQNNADFSSPVPEEPFTEVGQIARKYNQVIERVNSEITHRDNALTRFQESEMRKSAILNSSMDCIVSIDQLGRIMEFNPAAERTFGCLKKQVKGEYFIELFIAEADRDSITSSLAAGFMSSSGLILNRRNTYPLQRSPNHPFPAEITITKSTAVAEKQSEFTLHIRDVTRQRKLQERLKFLAYSDPLTGLFNRTYFLERLESSLENAAKQHAPVGVLFLDLDKFKVINDTLGHKAGDELLCEVAARLREVSKDSDVIARWGGDEFIVMLKDGVSKASLEKQAQKILNIMRGTFLLVGKTVSVPTSIGVAISQENNLEAELLIQEADIAMYWAKEKGRDNAQFYNSHMAKAAASRFDFEQDLKQALSDGHFELYYQPKVYLQKENLLGFEALIRWNHPTKGMIMPEDFIPLAEESRQIIYIDRWVIKQAILQLKTWCEQGQDCLPVAINLCSTHLVTDGLVDYVTDLLKAHKVAGELLEIEITEGVLLQDVELCIEVMAALKNLGIKISIDDFGTGYSSLSYLKRLPIDVLKIDKSFVRECDRRTEDAQLCETITQLAHNLELTTVAEGVESESQANMLKTFGCHIFQGYHYYPPLNCVETTKLLKIKP